MTFADEILDLRARIQDANHRYYDLDEPVMDDATYDEMFRRLRELETAHPELVTPDSPTQKVGGSAVKGFVKCAHLAPMMSLGNSKNLEEVVEFDERVRRRLAKIAADADDPEAASRAQRALDEGIVYVTEAKIDGLAMSLVYENGHLIRAVTRGDGTVGEDVTGNVKTIEAIPHRLDTDDPPALLEVRGEVYMPKEVFDELNEQRLAQGKQAFMNPRNGAAGAIRQHDSQAARERRLSFWAYSVGAHEGFAATSHSDAMEQLGRLGLPINASYTRVHDSLESVIAECERVQAERESIGYDIDGVVIKVDDLALQGDLGYTGKDPRWASAYKFPPTVRTTRLLEVEVRTGRTGILALRGRLEPVEVGGTLVTYVTLHNEGDMRRKDICLGDTVIIQRNGDVIPGVIGPVLAERDGTQEPFTMPDTCPSCDGPVTKDEEAARHLCENLDCPSRKINTVKHWAKRDALDIDTMGHGVIERLWDAGLVRSIPDIYDLHEKRDQILELEGFAQKGTDKLLTAIEQSRDQPWIRVLYGLGIPHIGRRASRRIVVAYPSIDLLLDAALDELAAVETMGPKKAQDALEWMAEPRNRELIEQLRVRGLNLEGEAPEEATGSALAGKTFVITGKFAPESHERIHGNREDIAAMITQAGGSVSGSISAKTDYLVAGEGGGSKRSKAEKLGVPIIGADELDEMLADAPDDSAPAAPLAGRTFVITGKFAPEDHPHIHGGRDEIAAIVEAAGGYVSGSVTGKTDFLLKGVGGGSKSAKAEKLGVPIIGATDLERMLAGTD
jgi:DNA ligase (NAD+)